MCPSPVAYVVRLARSGFAPSSRPASPQHRVLRPRWPCACVPTLGMVLPARLFGPLPPLRVRPLLVVLLPASQIGERALLARVRVLSPFHLVRAPPARILFTQS